MSNSPSSEESAAYQIIRVPLGLIKLWNHLAENPSLAKHVEVLEIQRQMSGFNFGDFELATVPPDFRSAADEFIRDNPTYHTFLAEFLPSAREAEKALIAAVKNMEGLKSFKWNREPPLLDSCLDEGVDEDIWTALRSCTALRALKIVDASDIEIENDDENDGTLTYEFRPIQESQIFSLSNIESFSYRTYGYNGTGRLVPVDDMIEMLSYRCPNMKSLQLCFSLYQNAKDFTTLNLEPLFGTVHWPKLDNIWLYGVQLSPSVASRFFSTHPSILSVTIIEATEDSRFIKSDNFDHSEPTTPDGLCFPAGTLPNITSFRAPEYFTLSLLASSTRSPRPLTELKLTITDEALEILPRLPSLRVFFTGVVSAEELKRLTATLPNLVELGATPAEICGREYDPKFQPTDIRDWVDCLSQLQQLEILHNPRIISEFDPPERIEALLRIIVSRCRSLRRISILCSSHYGASCIIERAGGGSIKWAIPTLGAGGSFVME